MTSSSEEEEEVAAMVAAMEVACREATAEAEKERRSRGTPCKRAFKMIIGKEGKWFCS